MLKYKCSQVPNVIYLEPESSWVKQNSEFNMELYYKDELHHIEKAYKKLANFVSKILKYPNTKYHDYPNITCEKPSIKTNTHFPLLPTKSTL